MGVTEEKIARFIVETTGDQISTEAMHQAKVGCFDCIGVMLAGAASSPGKIMADFVRKLRSTPETTVVGTGLHASLFLGALANGTLAHILDYDDRMGGFSHPTCVLLPPLISLGESIGASGKAILEAYVIGFTVGVAITSGCPHYSDEETGWHGTSMFGALAATAACARLLKLTPEQTVMAMGTAGSMGGGLNQNLGTYTKGLHAGLASQNGIMACLLAGDGWTGTDRLLESNMGFLSTYVGKDTYDLQTVRDCLDRRPLIVGTAIKRYPCCGGNHSVLDALLPLLAENNISFDDIQQVSIDHVPYTAPVMLYSEPTSGFQGKFSLRYNIATAILDRRIDIDSYTDEKLNRPTLREAMEKVEIHVLLPWDPQYSRRVPEYPITVTLKNGQTFHRIADRRTVRGTPANPLSDVELQAKFAANAARSLPASSVDRSCELWWNMEEMDDISKGMNALTTAL